mgnify:CR=1 FL=1
MAQLGRGFSCQYSSKCGVQVPAHVNPSVSPFPWPWVPNNLGGSKVISRPCRGNSTDSRSSQLGRPVWAARIYRCAASPAGSSISFPIHHLSAPSLDPIRAFWSEGFQGCQSYLLDVVRWWRGGESMDRSTITLLISGRQKIFTPSRASSFEPRTCDDTST